MTIGIIRIERYRPISVTLLESTSGRVTLGLNENKLTFVSIIILESGKISAHFTTETMVSSGSISIDYSGDDSFSVFAFSAQDGMDNGSLGKTKWGVFFSKGINNNDLVSVNDDTTNFHGTQLFVVPVSGSRFDIAYEPSGRSTAEYGDLWLNLKQ